MSDVVGVDLGGTKVAAALLNGGRFGVPAFIDKDATVAALAEAHDEELHPVARNLAMLTVGTGVGGGLVVGGRIYRGAPALRASSVTRSWGLRSQSGRSRCRRRSRSRDHSSKEGTFTGEVSAPMLIETGVRRVILGYSERRRHFGGSDRALQLKVATALEQGRVPILGVGESGKERERGETERRLRDQMQTTPRGSTQTGSARW